MATRAPADPRRMTRVQRRRSPGSRTTTAAGTPAPGSARARSQAVRTPSRIASLPAHEHPAGRQEYAPGLLMVKCREDVVANVPDLQAAHVAAVRALKLPAAVDSPFDYLLKQHVLREVRPVFSRLTRGRSFSIAPTSVAASFATSVRDSENEDLRGLNMLRLSPSAHLQKIEKDLRSTPGIEYVHAVPRRWMSAAVPNDPTCTKARWPTTLSGMGRM